MPGYRLYYFDAEGHISRAAEFECENDEQAVLHSQHQSDGATTELWSGARLIAKFPEQQSV